MNRCRWTFACALIAACIPMTALADTVLPFGATWRYGIFDQATAPLPQGVMPDFDESALTQMGTLPRGANPCYPDLAWPFAGWLVARTHVNLTALPVAVTVRWCGWGNVHFFLNGVNVFGFSQNQETMQTTTFTVEPFVVGDNTLALWANETPYYGSTLGFDISLAADFPTGTARTTWGSLKAHYR